MDLIAVERKDGYQFGIQVRGHDITCDMSEKDGGRDVGPSPVELFAGSFGACVAMIVQGYCQRHGYEGDVGVSLTVELADKPKRISRIIADVEVPEGVPEEKKEAIRRVAARCPIHQTLQSPPALDIEIV